MRWGRRSDSRPDGASVRQFDDGIDFDRDPQRQGRAADGGTRMATGFAEDFDHQVGGAVDHLRLVGKFGRAVDEPAKANDSLNPAEAAEGGFSSGRSD